MGRVTVRHVLSALIVTGIRFSDSRRAISRHANTSSSLDKLYRSLIRASFSLFSAAKMEGALRSGNWRRISRSPATHVQADSRW